MISVVLPSESWLEDTEELRIIFFIFFSKNASKSIIYAIYRLGIWDYIPIPSLCFFCKRKYNSRRFI